ncbi:MAG: bifunctional diguanylate cyclase/phosphodiesterase [Pseudomonadota bacterium]
MSTSRDKSFTLPSHLTPKTQILEPSSGQSLASLEPQSSGEASLDQPAIDFSTLETVEINDVLSTVSEVVYCWDFANDIITWGPNAEKILGVSDISQISRGSAFSLLIDPQYISHRYDDIVNAQHKTDDGAKGMSYRTKYKFSPNVAGDKQELWIEEYGRIFTNGDIAQSAKGVIRVINEHYEEEQRLAYFSKYDEVTGLINRFELIQAINNVISKGVLLNTRCAFLIAAIDNLKIINENFGFAIGDEVLSIVGSRLQDHMRELDVIGRFGSNKFGILLYDCAENQVHYAANRLIDVVRDNIIETSKGGLATSISIGAVLIPSHASTVQQVMSCALEALNHTKEVHGNSFVVYEPSETLQNWQKKNSLLADEVVRALNERRMCLALQPIVDPKNDKVAFYECLLRMRTPEGHIVSASEFIAVAEKLGISRLIDHRVLELAMDLIRMHSNLKISINVSGLTANDETWLDNFRAMIHDDTSITERIIVEITETSAIRDIDKSIEFVKTLKELGCQVAIDDFGAGYSSFKILKLLDVDMVKIDGEFVKGLRQNPNDRIFIKTLVDLAEHFHLETVAEWVYDRETAELLSGMGVGLCQGYWYGRPKLVEDYSDKTLNVFLGCQRQSA